MPGISDSDFKYFLKCVLNRHANREELPTANFVPMFEVSQSTEVDDVLIEKFTKALWFNTKLSSTVWKNIVANHMADMFASQESYISCVLHMLCAMNRIENYYERFLCCLSTVTAMAGFCHRERHGQFIHFTAAIIMYFFQKKLENDFIGGWKGLKRYVSSLNYLGFYNSVNLDARNVGRCNKKVETLAKRVPGYNSLQKMTYDELKVKKYNLLVRDVILCYNNVIYPHLESGIEESLEELDTGLAQSTELPAPSAGPSRVVQEAPEELNIGLFQHPVLPDPSAGSSRVIQGAPEELDARLAELSLSDALERVESSELRTASDTASRAIMEGGESSSAPSQESEALRKALGQEAKDQLISAIAETADAFLNQCPPGVLLSTTGEGAERCREELAEALENFRRESSRLCGVYKKAEAMGVSSSYASAISRRYQGLSREVRKQKGVVMSAAASKVYGPLKTVPPEKPEVLGNKVLHCQDGPDPWVLTQGATFQTGEYLKELITNALNVAADSHQLCRHRMDHPIPQEVPPSDFVGYSQEVRERLYRAECDRRLLLRTKSMVYDSKCEVDRLAELVQKYRSCN